MPPDAIQQDATAEQQLAAAADTPNTEQQAQDTETPRPLSPREEAMQAIAAKRLGELSNEGVVIEPAVEPPAGPGPKSDDEPPDAGAEDALDAQIAAQTQPTVIADGFDKVMVRVKIDGEEQEVPLSQVAAQYQKHSAADRRLAEATRLLREAEERAKAQTTQPPVEAPPAPGQDNSSAAPALTKEFLSALADGDEGKAAQAFERLVQGMQGRQQDAPTPIDPQAVAAEVKQQIAVESALDGFARDYADVCSDPYLANMADQKLAEHLQTGTPFEAALRQAGDDVRGWLAAKMPAPVAPTQPTTQRSGKLERKAEIDPIRTANLAATSQTAAAPRTEEQIRADAMAELRRARPGMAG